MFLVKYRRYREIFYFIKKMESDFAISLVIPTFAIVNIDT